MEYKNQDGKINIETFFKEFRINFNGEINFTRRDFINSNLIIKIEFTTDMNQILTEEIVLKLSQIKSEKK